MRPSRRRAKASGVDDMIINHHTDLTRCHRGRPLGDVRSRQGRFRVARGCTPDVVAAMRADAVGMTTGTATIDPEPTDGDPMTDQHQQAPEGLPPPFAPPPPPPPPSTPWYRVRVARDQPHKKIGGVVAGI